MMSQLTEVWDQNDDWRGMSSREERRKRQNRLHQRSHRKKRHLKRLALTNEPAPTARCSGDYQPCAENGRDNSQITSTVESLSIFQILRCHDIHQEARKFLLGASMAWSLRLLRPHDLPSVTRLNAFNALARNALILGIPVELLESDDDASPFLSHGAQPLETRAYPCQLAPTALQRNIKHHPWLDLFPIPRLRDNILHGIEVGLLDEDRLCQELVCDLLNLEANSLPSLILWGDSWDINGWEFSLDFFKKWGWLLDGSPEVWQATNYWRMRRREMTIEVALSNAWD